MSPRVQAVQQRPGYLAQVSGLPVQWVPGSWVSLVRGSRSLAHLHGRYQVHEPQEQGVQQARVAWPGSFGLIVQWMPALWVPGTGGLAGPRSPGPGPLLVCRVGARSIRPVGGVQWGLGQLAWVLGQPARTGPPKWKTQNSGQLAQIFMEDMAAH